MNTPRIRLVTENDAPALLGIYTPFVEHTAVTFEYEPPSAKEFAARIRAIAGTYPYLVCEDDSGICGYVYASAHNARKAYQWGVETTVYLDSKHQSRGLGTALYGALFSILRGLGYYTAYALITLPNEKSVGLHKARGFSPVGVLRQTGYKLNAWHDVLYMEAFLDTPHERPAPPRKIDPASPGLPGIFEEYSRLIRS